MMIDGSTKKTGQAWDGHGGIKEEEERKRITMCVKIMPASGMLKG
jgi:hypothetical protein